MHIDKNYLKFPNQIVDNPNITGKELLVLLVIIRHQPRSFPSRKTIAEKTGLSLASVKRALRNLVQTNTVFIKRTDGKSNEYIVSDMALNRKHDASRGGHHEPGGGSHRAPRGGHHEPLSETKLKLDQSKNCERKKISGKASVKSLASGALKVLD